jgi:hypothetical protein
MDHGAVYFSQWRNHWELSDKKVTVSVVAKHPYQENREF